MTTTLTACVHVLQLLVQLAVQQLAVPPPFAVVADAVPQARILDCCASACRAGVAARMHVMGAFERCPQLHVVTIAASIIDTARATSEAVLQRWSDEVLPYASTDWLLPLPALEVNYACAARIGAELEQNLTDATGLHTVVALAPTRSVAQIAVRDATVRGERQPLVVLPGEEQDCLAALPAEHLPLVGTRTREQLARLGVSTIGQLAALPVTTAVHIFGKGAQRSMLSNSIMSYSAPAMCHT